MVTLKKASSSRSTGLAKSVSQRAQSAAAYVVGPKGQVVIAREIRDRLGIQPGWVALQRLVGDHVEIFFLPPEHNRSLKGILGQYLQTHIPTGEAWDQARERAW